MKESKAFKVLAVVIACVLVITVASSIALTITGLSLLKESIAPVPVQTTAAIQGIPPGTTVGATQGATVGAVVSGVGTTAIASGNVVTTSANIVATSGGGAITTTAAATEQSDKMPRTDAEILAAYTAAMNKAKTDLASCNYLEYQSVPKEGYETRNEGWLIKQGLSLAEAFVTSEDEAEVLVKVPENGPDSKDKYIVWIPVMQSIKGCLLTDADFIKSADCKKLSDGNYQLTITLKEEHNSEPYKPGVKGMGKVGSMFNTQSKADIDNTIQNDSRVNMVIKDAEYDLRFYDCTAVLVYNPKNNHVVSLTHNLYCDIYGKGKFLGTPQEVYALLHNTMKIWDFKYK